MYVQEVYLCLASHYMKWDWICRSAPPTFMLISLLTIIFFFFLLFSDQYSHTNYMNKLIMFTSRTASVMLKDPKPMKVWMELHHFISRRRSYPPFSTLSSLSLSLCNHSLFMCSIIFFKNSIIRIDLLIKLYGIVSNTNGKLVIRLMQKINRYSWMLDHNYTNIKVIVIGVNKLGKQTINNS